MISKTVVYTILFYLVRIILAEPDGTIVQLEKGKIQGIIRKSENGNDYYAFQEIPYAAPPVGSKRFQLPQEPKPWEGILNTTRNTKVCIQPNIGNVNLEQRQDEDCLYLNVYTPVKPGSNKNLLPVLLWIHGGAFVFGSGRYEEVGPKYVIDHGIVVVTINYRVGPFGFVGTDDGTIPLNLGLKDQRLAIEWVNKNIELFGGNPNQVVIAGESAGSMSLAYHISSQKPDENLFHGVIMQSGSSICSGLKQSNPNSVAFNLGKLVDKSFSSNSTSELLTVLQNADVNDIKTAGITGAVTVEKEGLFSVPAYQAFIDKKYKKVPVLIGINSEEGLAFSLPKDDDKLKEIDADLTKLISDRVNIAPENRQTVGLLLKQLYVGNSSFEKDFGGYIKYRSDMVFTNGVTKQVELSCTDAPYYFYQFSYKGELGHQMGFLPTLPDNVEKVTHAEDLPYLWEDSLHGDLSQYPKEDGLTLHRIVKMWTNFVKYFNPTPEPDPLLGNITWFATEPNSLRYLNINATCEMREHPRHYQQVKEILEKYMVPPFDSFS
ncbi:unnamed protein product [Psylliodes chrysocephalus]|uniref:Carboxylic ester hydrolase n=1 Tax=Psylliodes chrysocephalus TaxID=3402493 RepID=A0A9P0GKW7_9CUCU|nr:unnamed protein product [Psylliodes chrysocephala]